MDILVGLYTPGRLTAGFHVLMEVWLEDHFPFVNGWFVGSSRSSYRVVDWALNQSRQTLVKHQYLYIYIDPISVPSVAALFPNMIFWGTDLQP